MKKLDFIKKLKFLDKKNVIFVGHMGSGKSMIVSYIAKNIKIKHYDSDIEIVKYEKKSINQIFNLYGEKYFRKIEEQTILNLLEKQNVIISLGGGSILSKKIRYKIKKNSFSVFLDTPLIILNKRLLFTNKRPLLKNQNIKKKLKILDKERRKYYLNSDLIIKNEDSIKKSYIDFVKSFFKI